MSEEQPISPSDDGGLGALQTDLLAGKTHTKSDLRMVARAARERWPIPDAKRPAVVTRLLEIVEKREVTVMTKDGPETLDGPADANASTASRVLIAMDSLNQADEHLADKNERLDSGKPTERIVEGIDVNVPGMGKEQT